MGQQQLLLVILVTIIVGIATVVAINIFGTAADEANRDAVRQDLLAASAQAQGVWARPTLMGGAGRDFNDNTAITPAELLSRLNIPGSATEDAELGNIVVNDNGTYSISIQGASELTIEGDPASGGDVITAIVCRNSTTGNWLVDVGTPATKPGDCD